MQATFLLQHESLTTAIEVRFACRIRTVLWMELSRLGAAMAACLLVLQDQKSCWPSQVCGIFGGPYFCTLSHYEVGAALFLLPFVQ